MSAFCHVDASTSKSPSTADDGELDPAAFLKSVRELSDKRDREDAERYRRLEEEVAKSRAERAVRRADRARSISPEKAGLPSGSSKSSLRSLANAPKLTSPPQLTSPAATTANMETGRANPPSPTKDIPEFAGFGSLKKKDTVPIATPPESTDGSPRPSQSATSLARSGTLSWQRRPASGTGTRPVSMIVAGNNAHMANDTAEQVEPSRDQIAAALESRSPAWFRQTPDRDLGSAALRKSRNESQVYDTTPIGRRELPGMTREPALEADRQSVSAQSESVQSDGPTPRDSGMASTSSRQGFTTNKPDLKSLIDADEQQKKAWSATKSESSTDRSQSQTGRNLAMSTSQARLANVAERPVSPTKGMGGFVQSAMMRRSDSQSKRSSVHSGATNLSRQGSLAGLRSGYAGVQGSQSMPKLEPITNSQESNNDPSHRPALSNNSLANLTHTQFEDGNDMFDKSAPRSHGRSKSVVSAYSTNEARANSPPTSPSKRFSPNKSSWIESALTRPDSPTKSSPVKNTQPSWMAGIAKARAQRSNGESVSTTASSMVNEDEQAKPSPPLKPGTIGQSLLKRSDGDLAPTPRSVSPPLKADPATTATRNLPKVASLSAAESIKDESETHVYTEAEAQNEVDDAESAGLVQPIKMSKEAVSNAVNSTKMATPTKGRPETPAKPTIDFRSNLRARAPPEQKREEAPEFLSRVGNLRKTQSEKYVAPDLFKDNITRGKADLAKTGGPVKTARKDELKESLLARKEDIKRAKEEGRDLPGQAHEKKAGGPPAAPTKPEALAKRELLGRSESAKLVPTVDRSTREATPEALARHKSLQKKPIPEHPPEMSATQPKFDHLTKQTSAPASMESKQSSDVNKFAARFNPSLAGMLARGPPSTNASIVPSRSESLADQSSGPSAPAADGAPLQDMRKGRAKGPKKRKQGDGPSAGVTESTTIERAPAPTGSSTAERKTEKPIPLNFSKPRAPPGSAASLMKASLDAQTLPKTVDTAKEKPTTPAKSTSVSNPGGIASSPVTPLVSAMPSAMPSTARKNDVAEFTGFGPVKRPATIQQTEDDKETNSKATPSIKSIGSVWGMQPSPRKGETPPQILLPSRKDEEAAMRSAGLLASASAKPSLKGELVVSPEGTNGHAAAPPASGDLPPRPTKSSRVVSGQLQKANPNEGSIPSQRQQPDTEAERLLVRTFGSWPTSDRPLLIDTRAVIASGQDTASLGTGALRKTVEELLADGSLRTLPPREEYTLFERSVYICQSTVIAESGTKRSQIFVWAGALTSSASAEQAQALAKKLARGVGANPVQLVHQGHEPLAFLQAFGGILVTRRSSRGDASQKYMLRGRQHLSHITFDEVEFEGDALCSGFAYLISSPTTPKQTKLYLWKGSACSVEEVSAARLVAMDLSESGEVIEVNEGAEFAKFLRIFGPGTTKASLPKSTELWRRKSRKPSKFAVRLYRIQQAEPKASLITSLFNRRPSWNSLSPSRSPSRPVDDIKVEAKHISPFTQSDLEAEGVYLLDAYSELFVLLGPLFPSQPADLRDPLLAQALLFASDYAILSASIEDRPAAPPASVLFAGAPRDVKMLFRHWDDGRGLWATAGLMAGSRATAAGPTAARVVPLEDVCHAVVR